MSSTVIAFDNNQHAGGVKFEVHAFPKGHYGATRDYVALNAVEHTPDSAYVAHFRETFSYEQACEIFASLRGALQEIERAQAQRGVSAEVEA